MNCPGPFVLYVLLAPSHWPYLISMERPAFENIILNEQRHIFILFWRCIGEREHHEDGIGEDWSHINHALGTGLPKPFAWPWTVIQNLCSAPQPQSKSLSLSPRNRIRNLLHANYPIIFLGGE